MSPGDGNGFQEVLELTSGARALQLKHDLGKADRSLRDQWKDYTNKMASIEERKKQMEERRSNIKENYKRLNIYLQDVNTKRKQALERVHQIKSIRSQKEEDIQKLNQELNQLRQAKAFVQDEVKKYSKFESYLKQVSSVGGANEVNDVIKVASTLTQERDNLLEGILKNETELEVLREDYYQYQQSKSDEIVNLNLELFSLKESTCRLKDRITEEEKKCIESSLISDQRVVKIYNIIRSGDNLLQSLNLHAVPEQDVNKTYADVQTATVERFTKVVEMIKDMSDIVKKPHKKIKDLG